MQFGRKKANTDAVLRTATKFSDTDSRKFASKAERTVYAYLRSVYSQDISLIPLSPEPSVTERLYLKTASDIKYDKSFSKRELKELEILSFRYFDSVNIAKYAVSSLSYDAAYRYICYVEENGRKGFSEKSLLSTFTFINDPRLGFILDEVTFRGPVYREAK